jgi:methyl-accepting chemotaxis protein
MRWPKLSLRGKIMGTIIAVAMLVVAIGAWKASNQIRESEGLGTYLEKHFKQRLESGQRIGASEYAITKLIASDPELAQQFATADAAAIAEAGNRALDSLQGTVAPDLLMLSDAKGAAPALPNVRRVPEAEWRSSRLFQELREGKTVRAKFALLGGKAYRVSGVPVRSLERVVGVVLFGRDLQSWFESVAAATPGDVGKQYRFSLIVDDREVIASALPQNERSILLQGLKKPFTVHEGDKQFKALDLDKLGDYDYWQGPISGYAGNGDPDTNELGNLVLIRSRTSKASKINDQIQETLLVFGLALAVAVAMGFLLALQITGPLQRYIRATEQLGRGQADLGKRLEVEAKDELGMLAKNLNRVFAKIHSLAAGVQRTAFQVNASSGEISAMSRKMLDGAKEQALKISNSTAAVTELSSSIQQVAENAAEATRTAKQSGDAVTRAIARLEQIRRTVEEAAHRIGALGESGKRIGNIVEVIRQISEQTSMLALNAAIEAAHAGEHGRGFAVVADEVSSLAKRTGQSARDIEDLIAAIRDQTGEAVRAMQTGTQEVEEGTTLVETTLADLKTLVNVINDTASAVQEQAIASDEIARNMDAVQRIASAVVGNSENAVNEGERLQRLADELEHSVKGFKIDPERAALDEAELKALPESRND